MWLNSMEFVRLFHRRVSEEFEFGYYVPFDCFELLGIERLRRMLCN